jgi:hypothetical protein
MTESEKSSEIERRAVYDRAHPNRQVDAAEAARRASWDKANPGALTGSLDKDQSLAKKLGRQHVVREVGEADGSYIRRLRTQPKAAIVLTDEQVKLAWDMHAIHSATARGYILPPLPVSDEQKADDEAKAQEMGVKPVLRDPGETDESFDARLATSPVIEPNASGAQAAAITRNPGERDEDFNARRAAAPAGDPKAKEAADIAEGQRLNDLKIKQAQEDRARANANQAQVGQVQTNLMAPTQTTYPTHVDQPVFAPVEHPAPVGPLGS